MRILFLHLSDIHMEQDDNIEIKKIDKLIEALNVVKKIDECIIICSGDLASTGNFNEYRNIRRFFGNVIKKIKEIYFNDKFINFLLVPGNHDANFSGIIRSGKDIQNYYKNNEIECHIEEEIKMFENFFDYSQINNCFKYDKIFNKRFISFGDYKIQFNLVNTSLFSTLLPDDKELHYFPKEKLSYLSKCNNVDIAITIMHHSTEWFQWECKKELEKAIYDSSSILFLGHDHDLKTKVLNINNKGSIFISAGGEFNSKDIIGKSEFNAIIFNTNTNSIDSYAFEWNAEGNLFCHKKLFENQSLDVNINKLFPKKAFIENIIQDEKRKIAEDFNQYFVFPTLIGKKEDKYSDKLQISSMQDFINELNNKKYINIVGGDNSGKTTVLKRIFLELADEKIPLLFTMEFIKGVRVDKVVKTLFEEQYSDDPLEYVRYQQVDKSNKVAIIDDFDVIKNKKRQSELINLLKDEFEYIIIGTKNFEEFNIIDNVRNDINSGNNFYVLEISNFYYKKRYDLIGKICKIVKQVNDEDLDHMVNMINRFISHQIQIFDLNPDFIIQYTLFYLQNSNYESQKKEEIFNKIFETNIYNAIIQNSPKNIVDETITALEELAYYIHFNKKDPLSLSDLQAVINEYNKKYAVSVNAKQLVDVACKAKILKQLDDSFSVRFCNKNYLAFFVARCLNRRININNSFEDIEYILKNICFGINDNIVLFISYLTNNSKIIMLICKYADDLMDEWDEFDIDSGNIKYLSKIHKINDVTAPKQEDKQKADEMENKVEEEIKSNQSIECVNLYDYNENDIDKFQYKIIRALKYTEMISKSLPGFHNILLKENKEKLANRIYRYPNKIIFNLLKRVDDNYEKKIQDLKDFADSIGAKNKKGELITREEVEIAIKASTLSLILNIYNEFAYLATDKKSIDILDAFCPSNNNHNIFNLMIIDNYGNTDAFIKKSEAIYNYTKNQNISRMVKLIVKKHLIYTENMKASKRQQLVDKYFKSGDKTTFLIEKYKHIS